MSNAFQSSNTSFGGSGVGGSPQYNSAEDYRLGHANDGGPQVPVTRYDLNPFRAPWPLLVAAVVYFLAAAHWVYHVVDSRLVGMAYRRDSFDIIALGVGVVVLAIFVAYVLNGHAWARWALTAWSVLALFFLLHGTLWTIGIGAIIGTVLIWLPNNSGWLR